MTEQTRAHDEEIFSWEEGRVRVLRRVDTYSRDAFRPLTPQEFAAGLLAAAEGLDDARVLAGEFYETYTISVEGVRDPTPDEAAEQERREHAAWLSAKEHYERGLAEGRTAPPDA